MDFAHLHLHSHLSILDSIAKPKDIVRRAKELNMSAVAITDHGVVGASIALYKACKAEKIPSKDSDEEWNDVWSKEIKPIIGIEFYISPTNDHTLKEPLEGHPGQQNYHLTALAKNGDGVSQIYELSSRGFLEGFYYKPRVSLKMIEEIGKDLILMGACAKGPISWNLLQGNLPAAKKWLTELKERFNGRFYLELMDHGIDWQKEINKSLLVLSRQYDIPYVATNDAHFIKREDHYEHSLMMCLQTKQKLDPLTMKYPEECYIKSREEMESLFGPAACNKTLEIAEQINIELDLKTTHFPEYVEEKVNGNN